MSHFRETRHFALRARERSAAGFQRQSADQPDERVPYHFDHNRPTLGTPFPCGAKAVGGGRGYRFLPNRTTTPEYVTCKRCLRSKVYKVEVARLQEVKDAELRRLDEGR